MIEVAPCLLIVDPDEVFSAAVAAEARAVGWRAVCCRNWWEAKPLIEGGQDIAAMIVELVQPEGAPNGLSAALMSRARRRGLPVIFTSAEPELLREIPDGTGVALSKTVGPRRLAHCAVELLEGGDGQGSASTPCLSAPARISLTPVGRYKLDRRTRFRSVNDSALVLWGKRREELLGRPLLEVFPQMAGQTKFRAHLDVLSGGRPYEAVMQSVILREPIDIHIAADRMGLKVDFRLAA